MHDWMWYGIACFAAAVVASIVAARRGSWARPAIAVALLNLLFVLVNSSAPFRGLLDPGYAGYRNGWLEADGPVAVFLTAGLMLTAASLAAIVAASNSVGRPMLLVAMIDGFFLLNTSTAFGVQVFGTNRDFEIQFGEYLTIPNVPAIAINFGLFVVPLIAATVWASRRALWLGTPTESG